MALPERKKPELHVVAICQCILFEPNRAASLVRIGDKFIGVLATDVPAGTPISLYLEFFTRWANGAGDYTEKLFVTGPDGRRAQLGEGILFHLADVKKAYQIGRAGQIAVNRPGDYRLEAFLDDETVPTATIWFGVEIQAPPTEIKPGQV